MFDQLLSQLENALAQAKTTSRPQKSASEVGEYGGVGCDITKPFGNVASFGKTQRFKYKPKQQLKTQHIDWQKSQLSKVTIQTGCKFTSSQRFEDPKPKYNQTFINPNIAVIKKNITNNVPLYKKSVGKDLSKSNVSVSTVASQSFRGPGIYQIKEDNKVKNGAFLKDRRFRGQQRKYEDTPLLINENQTRKRPPSAAVLKPKTIKTKNLINIEQQQALRQRLKFIYWKNIPLELDRLYKNNKGAIISQDYFNLKRLSGTYKKSALLMLLNKLHYLRGGYQQNIASEMTAACAVVYRKSTPKPFKFSEMDPGPDFYYPTDDLVRENPVAFSFAKQGMKENPVKYDYRDYQIKEQILKSNANIIINPIHKEHRLTQQQIRNIARGPGFYDCLFSQIEKRADIGVIKFQQITEKNDRQNNCVQIGQVNDGIYYPSYSALDPNIPAPLFKQPANIKPMHLPDKVLFPEHWLFYDGDLNKVRAEIAKNVILAKNMNFSEYKEYSEKFKRFKQYLEIQKKIPEVGEYLVKYDAIDPHIQVVDMAKQEEKTLLDPIVKPEGHSAGDNLILNPNKFEDHLPNMQFKKMVGRQEVDFDRQGEPRQGDRLIINPTKPQKHVPTVDFKRQDGRPETNQFDEHHEGPQGDILILNPKPIEKHIGNIDFAKQAERQQIKTSQNQNQQVIITNPKQQTPTIKGVPFSRLSSVRMVPILRSRLKQQKLQDE